MIAAKTLTAVEVDPSISNQHEFHAGTIRNLLRFEGSVRGTLVSHFYLGDDGEPVLDEDEFFLYDARARNPNRSEWHLYYYSKKIPELARPGDLLVLLRPDITSPDLHALIARQNTRFDRQLRRAFELGDVETIQRFAAVEANVTQGQASQITLPLVAAQTPQPLDITRHPVFLEALETGKMPNTRAMARAAFDLVSARHSQPLDPDEYLVEALDAESELFFAIESALGERELGRLLAGGAGFEIVLAFAMRKHQARKSRRGLSLQNHVAALFDRYGIQNSPQCTTEPGETPDFVVPGCAAYHDPAFPEERLFMVGCKSKLRDRWRQYLHEARRIPIKFHVSIDPDLSDGVIDQMHEANLRLFMPRRILEGSYAGRRAMDRLSSISTLLDILR